MQLEIAEVSLKRGQINGVGAAVGADITPPFTKLLSSADARAATPAKPRTGRWNAAPRSRRVWPGRTAG